MPTITSAGSGNASAGATWVGGVAPTLNEDARIAKNHTVTLDTTGINWKSLTLDNGTAPGEVGAILTCTTSANWDLTIQEGITANGSTTSTYSSTVNLDMSSASAYTGTITINNAVSGSPKFTISGHCTLKGVAKTRWTKLTATVDNVDDVSATVTSNTNWATGDLVCFGSTGAAAWPPLTDEKTLTSVSAGNIGWSGACTNQHLSGGVVANFSSNLRIKTGADYAFGILDLSCDSRNRSGTATVRDVELYRLGASGYLQAAIIIAGSSSTYHTGLYDVSNNAFYDIDGACVVILNQSVSTTRDGNAFLMRHGNTGSYTIQGFQTVSGELGPDSNYCILRHSNYDYAAVYAGGNGQHQVGADISGGRAQYSSNVHAIRFMAMSLQATDCRLYGNPGDAIVTALDGYAADCSFGAAVFASAVNGTDIKSTSAKFTAERCVFASDDFGGMTSVVPNAQIELIDKNAVSGAHETIGPHSNTTYCIKRVTDTKTRSTSAYEFKMTASTAVSTTLSVLAKADSELNILAYVMKSGTPSYGASTLPYMELSGMGITPVRVTMSGGTAADTWELLTLTLDAGSAPTVDGLLTLTLVAQSATSGAKAWFSGVPGSRYITRARHYGKVFNETSPTVTTDTLTSANEATAAGYTGITITWDDEESSVEINGSTTFQKLYDYHQSQAVLNVGSALALTGAGAAGSPALFAAGDITITDGDVLNGAGSIAMGAFLLSTEFTGGQNYTYTGGTWSQLTTIPTFSGGTLTLGAAATLVFTTASATRIDFTPAAPSTYALGGCTFTGELDLRNATADAITVEVPTGTSYTTANNTGGVITVSEPVTHVYARATCLSASHVLLYNQTQATVIDNTTLVGTDYEYEITTEADPDDILELRVSKLGYQCDTSLGTWNGTSDLTFVVSQPAWANYTALGVDGSAVTEYALDVPNIEVDADDADGESTKKRLIAFICYAMTTDDGAEYFWGALTDEDAANWRINTDVVDLYVDNTGSSQLTMTDIDIRLYRDDGASWILSPSTSGYGISNDTGKIYIAETGVSGLTAEESAKLTAIPSNPLLTTDARLDNLDAAVSTRLASASYTAPPSAATNATAVRSELTTELGRIDAAVSTRLASASYTAPPSAATNAAAVLAEQVGDGTITLAQAQRVLLAVAAGKDSGLPFSPVFRDLADTKDVVSATLDGDGNRSAVTVNP